MHKTRYNGAKCKGYAKDLNQRVLSDHCCIVATPIPQVDLVYNEEQVLKQPLPVLQYFMWQLSLNSSKIPAPTATAPSNSRLLGCVELHCTQFPLPSRGVDPYQERFMSGNVIAVRYRLCRLYSNEVT